MLSVSMNLVSLYMGPRGTSAQVAYPPLRRRLVDERRDGAAHRFGAPDLRVVPPGRRGGSSQPATAIADLRSVREAKISSGRPRLLASSWRGTFAIQSDNRASE